MLYAGTWPGRALFFGAFAYFAAMFFYTPGRPAAYYYLVPMGLSFGFAVVVTSVGASVSLQLEALTNERAKEHFAVSAVAPMRWLYFLYLSTILLFFAGFFQIGYIKPGFDFPWDPQGGYTYVIVGGGLAGLAYASLFLILEFNNVWVGEKLPAKKIYKDELNALEVDAKLPAREAEKGHSSSIRSDSVDVLADNLIYEAWKARAMQRNISYSTQASFVAGNAFYEVLFTDINPQYPFQSYVYVICCVATTVAGCLVVMLATSAAVNLVNDYTFSRVDSRVFNLFSLMTFTWLVSLLVLDRVKYDILFMNTTLIWGAFGLSLFVVAFSVLSAIHTQTVLILQQGVAGSIRVRPATARIAATPQGKVEYD